MAVLFPDKKITGDDAIVWQGDALYLLDQRLLPARVEFIRLTTAKQTADAIRDMVVRGAPAIGITAAYGVVLSVMQHGDQWRENLQSDVDLLAAARPTAVNLFWALRRMQQLAADIVDDNAVDVLLREARLIHEQDIAANRRMGELGAALIQQPTSVITHCNAGALATGGYGTALGVIRSGFAQGRIRQVYADETRPWLQGSRLTAWELHQDSIPVSVIADVAAAAAMARGDVGWVIVGSDRIAANGDIANKIGTCQLAIAARYHGVKFMVAAPISTIDPDAASGADIPVEERDPEEVLSCGNHRVGAEGVTAWNPVFDVTPAELVDAIVTERGVVESPNSEKMAELLSKSGQSN
ncbi:MAG TPA: S-methyl-5-thioribose-1-phosphate isomerase [Gammaproteobacteria bacterium]|nr:S-methyl-5-thioribose-1-phosphate isomerase [Gammaproteobacteria bacterium]